MQAFLLLCDSAQSDPATGKIHMLGAGWSVTGPVVPAMTIAVFLRLSWDEAGSPREFNLYLVDEDGESVTTSSPEGGRPIQFGGSVGLDKTAQVEVDEILQKTGLQTSFTVSVPPPPLSPGRHYKWIFTVNDEELSSIPFSVRPLPED
ncbi:hypothetical protein [Streptosporangium sp. NPDC049078]|uniref:DUF6941 family protein n=1 Tax=Streptosporangium sp. NPDC049078 TaxID=3155767 RepID=UPI00342E3C28